MKSLLKSLPLLIPLLNIVVGAATSKGTVSERIVTNYDDVVTGVPIDFRYNQTSLPKSGLPSVPGCPRSEAGIPWLYYGPTTKCHLAGEKGPCDYNEKLFVQLGSLFGICNCECFFNESSNLFHFNFKKMQFCEKNDREFVFHPGQNRCYVLGDQGPCKPNEWLMKVDESNSSPVTRLQCEAAKCSDGKIPVSTKAQNKDFDPEKDCRYNFGAYASPAFVSANDCEEGTTYSELLQKCVKQVDVTGKSGGGGIGR